MAGLVLSVSVTMVWLLSLRPNPAPRHGEGESSNPLSICCSAISSRQQGSAGIKTGADAFAQLGQGFSFDALNPVFAETGFFRDVRKCRPIFPPVTHLQNREFEWLQLLQLGVQEVIVLFCLHLLAIGEGIEQLAAIAELLIQGNGRGSSNMLESLGNLQTLTRPLPMVRGIRKPARLGASSRERYGE